MATTPTTRPQPSSGCVTVRPADIGDLLGALDLGDVADGEEDRRLGQAVHGHVQQAREIGERSAHAESEGDDPHMLDRRIGEHPLDVAAPVQHECRRRSSETRPMVAISGPGAIAPGLAASSSLKRKHGVQRDVEQQARQHRRDRRRTFGMRVRQPGVQRREPDLGAVAEQQEDEGDVQQRGIEGCRVRDQHGPDHRRRDLRRPPGRAAI